MNNNNHTHQHTPTHTLQDGGLFIYDRGCVMTNNIVILVACESLFYIIIAIVLLILCFRIEKDTWFIKRESLILVAIQFGAILLFAICGFVPVFTKITDFFIPYGFVLMSYSFCEVVLSVFMPIIYQIVLDSKNGNHFISDKRMKLHQHQQQHISSKITNTGTRKNTLRSDLERFLENRKTFELLLDFAKRSYCPESVLCYKDIERFKTSLKHRKTISLHILKTYLKPNSPLELNYPKLDQIHDEIMKSIIVDANSNSNLPSASVMMSNNSQSSSPTSIPPNLFDDIQLHCLQDMTDVFERLKSQSKQVRNILREWKEEEENNNPHHRDDDDDSITMTTIDIGKEVNGGCKEDSGQTVMATTTTTITPITTTTITTDPSMQQQQVNNNNTSQTSSPLLLPTTNHASMKASTNHSS